MLPLYLEKLTFNELRIRAEKLIELQHECKLCPRQCLAKREEKEKGICDSTQEVIISSTGPHFGEEPPLVGRMGSGTIFLSHCNLECVYCQNFSISQLGYGSRVDVKEIAEAMVHLQNRGCHNINFVTPTHYISQLIKALIVAVGNGLEIPIVYNCGGYENIEVIKLLDGIIDIYMPDAKYSNNEIGWKYSGVQNYWDNLQGVIKEMHNQVGDLKISKRRIAQRGLLVRHLVLPNKISGSEKILDFIAEEISIDTYVNIMDQYRPAFNANKFRELNRCITEDEYQSVIRYAQEIGLHRGFIKNF